MSPIVPHVETIAFADAELLCLVDDGDVLVSLRHACDGIGIDYSNQLKKLKGHHWATVVLNTTVGQDGKLRELAMVNLDTLSMWLATINSSRVAPEARETVERYQLECVRVLREHFFQPRQEPAAPALTADPDVPRVSSLPGIDEVRAFVDVIHDWVTERYEGHGHRWYEASTLRQWYIKFCEREGVEPMTKRVMESRMRELGVAHQMSRGERLYQFGRILNTRGLPSD